MIANACGVTANAAPRVAAASAVLLVVNDIVVLSLIFKPAAPSTGAGLFDYSMARRPRAPRGKKPAARSSSWKLRPACLIPRQALQLAAAQCRGGFRPAR